MLVASPSTHRRMRNGPPGSILAACYRLADRFGLNEGIDNHLTLLVPGYSDRFLLAPFGMHWSDGEGQRFSGGGFRRTGRERAGFGGGYGAVYPSAGASVVAAGALRAAHPHAVCDGALHAGESAPGDGGAGARSGFYEDVAYDPTYNGLAFDVSEGERLARALGGRNQCS